VITRADPGIEAENSASNNSGPNTLNLHLVAAPGMFYVEITTKNAMKELLDAWKQVDRNKIAAILSIVPGLGHLYKHHYRSGLGIMIAGNALMLFVALWLSIATLGLALIIVPAMWFAGIAYSAYCAPDEHGMHPWLHVWNYHRGKISELSKNT